MRSTLPWTWVAILLLQGLLQHFIVRQLGGGWYVNSAPSITVNWNAKPGQKWVLVRQEPAYTLPIGHTP